MLPGIGGLEYIFIAILLIIFVGPKDLPFLIRSLGRTFGKIKNLAKEFKLMINDMANDMANESGVDEIKNTADKAQSINLTEEITNSINDTIKDNIDKEDMDKK